MSRRPCPTRRVAAVLLALVSLPALACDSPATTAELQSALVLAHAAYSNLDADAFHTQSDAVRAALPCLVDPISPSLAAEVHRLEGLRGFLDKDPAQATRAFAAARRIEPAYRFPTTMVPENNPVLEDYEAIEVSQLVESPVGPPESGTLTLDGREQLTRVEKLPVVAQYRDQQGGVVFTEYVAPSAALPNYPLAPAPVTKNHRGGKGARIGLAAGAGLAAASSAALFAMSGAAKQDWQDAPLGSPSDVTTLGELRTKTNTLSTAGVVSSALTVGLGAGAALVGRF